MILKNKMLLVLMVETGKKKNDIKRWSSAKGYSFRNMYFIFSCIIFVVSIIFF